MTDTPAAWNLDLALRNVDGDVDHLRDLLHIWIVQTTELMETIAAAARTDDLPALQFAAHTLRSSLQILGADRAHEVAAELEQRGKAQRLDGVAELATNLMALINELRAEVNAYLESA